MCGPAPRVRDWLLQLTQERGPDKTICPSEVAQMASPHDWRELMPVVRAEAIRLCKEGKVVFMQRGEMVDRQQLVGPFRLRGVFG